MPTNTRIPAKNIVTFGISPDSGFLKPHTTNISLLDLDEIYPAFATWGALARTLPEFYSIRGLAQAITCLPNFPTHKLTYEFYPWAFQMLTWITSGLVHPYRSQEVGSGQVVPAKLAQPVCLLALDMGRLPIMSYEEYCLTNCLVNDKNLNRSTVEIENLHLCQGLIEQSDEWGFIAPHQAMEWKGAPIPANVGLAQEHALNQDNLGLKSLFWKMSAAMHDMISQQLLMWKYCDPSQYQLVVRPQIQRFDNVIFEGVTTPPFDKPVSLRGETGAQSPLFRTIDAFLGVKHQKTGLTDHLAEMEAYMTLQHRQFIRAVEEGPFVREYVLAAGEADRELDDAYNSMVYALITLRKNHFGFMGYISGQRIGTGGTPFEQFLTQFIRETEECLIRRNGKENK